MLLLLIAAFVLVLGPFAIAIFISELGKVKENRQEARRAHQRIDLLVEEMMTPEERAAHARQKREQADRDKEARDFYEYGGC